MAFTEDDFDRESELKAFDKTKQGVKGLVDSGITKVPRIFIQQSDNLPQTDANFDLPIINLHGFSSDPATRNEIVRKIGEASRKLGFFQVINHGIPANVLTEVRNGALRFFNQDHEEKRKWYDTEGTKKKKKVFYYINIDISYTVPVRWRDTLFCKMAPDPPTPQELPPPCRDILIEYSKHAIELGWSLFELLSESLGLGSNYLKDINGCADEVSILYQYYPPSPQPELTLGAQKHTDNDYLTILLQDHIGGLQFLHRNQWLNIPFVPGALVVNIGHFLQLISNDEFISAEHRVLSSDIGPRISVPCFFMGRVSKSNGLILEPIKELVSKESPAKYRPTTMMEFVQHTSSKVFDKTSLLHFRIN